MEETIKNKAKVSKIMDIFTFQDGINKGIYSDEKGTAYLILNGTLYTTYNVYIDRQRVTKSGSIVSFDSLLKSYPPEDIQFRYDLKTVKQLQTIKPFKERNDYI